MADTTTPETYPAPRRKTPRKYEIISFTLDDYEGEFRLPRIQSVPPALLSRLAGKTSDSYWPLIEFLAQIVGEEMAATIAYLADTEIAEFFEKWSKASEVDPGK